MKIKNIVYNHNKFRLLIDNSGFTISKLGERIGIDCTLVNRHYNGYKKRPISVYYLEKYCKYFGVTPNYFYDLETEKQNDKEIKLSICEYTGLSENAIDLLLSSKETVAGINAMLESSGAKQLVKGFSDFVEEVKRK